LSLYHDTGDYETAVGIFRPILERARKAGDHAWERVCLANWAHVENDELHFQYDARDRQEDNAHERPRP